MAENTKIPKKSKLNSHSNQVNSQSSQNFMKHENSIPTSENNELNYQKYLLRDSLFTKYNYEHKVKVSEGNKSLTKKLTTFDKSYESVVRNTHEERKNQEQFHKLYEKLKRETEEYLKKKEGKTYEDLAFAELVAYYTKIGYKIPHFTKNKNLFDESPLLLPNEKISDYYLFVEKLNDLVDTKLKKGFYKDLNLLHDLTDQINNKISGKESQKIGNIDKESNMVMLNRIKKEGTRIEMQNIMEQINMIKSSFKDLKHLDTYKSENKCKEVYKRLYSLSKHKREEFIEKNENYLNTMQNAKSRGDVLLPLPNNSNKQLHLKTLNNYNKFLFNHNRSDSTNEALSTYFDTKSSFNHSKTINQPHGISSEKNFHFNKENSKLGSTKMNTKIDLISLKNGKINKNTKTFGSNNSLIKVDNPNNFNKNLTTTKNLMKMSSILSHRNHFSELSQMGYIIKIIK